MTIITTNDIASDIHAPWYHIEFANGVETLLRTPTEADLRTFVDARAMALILLLYHPIQNGEAIRDPFTYANYAIAVDPDTQWTIVSMCSTLPGEEIDRMNASELLTACAEVLKFVRREYPDEMLMNIIVDEMRLFMPGLPEGRV